MFPVLLTQPKWLTNEIIRSGGASADILENMATIAVNWEGTVPNSICAFSWFRFTGVPHEWREKWW